MKRTINIQLIIFLLGLAFGACTGKSASERLDARKEGNPIQQEASMRGTWQLLTVLTIEEGDSSLADYTRGVKGIKMLNETHFAFFQHDLNRGTDSTAIYVSGGGPYTFQDGVYTEHLEYCNFRVYENNTFTFEVSINGDTLIQRGEEEVAEAGVSKYIIETYVRVNEADH